MNKRVSNGKHAAIRLFSFAEYVELWKPKLRRQIDAAYLEYLHNSGRLRPLLVAAWYFTGRPQLNMQEVFGQSRRKEFVRFRMVVAYYLRQEKKLPIMLISRIIGRKHPDTTYLLKTFGDEMRTYTRVRTLYNAFKEKTEELLNKKTIQLCETKPKSD